MKIADPYRISNLHFLLRHLAVFPHIGQQVLVLVFVVYLSVPVMVVGVVSLVPGHRLPVSRFVQQVDGAVTVAIPADHPPGVGAQGGSASDAILAGADYVIVGRSIYNAEDPASAAQKIADDIKQNM